MARYAAGDPGFRAAHLMGGITRMAPTDEFPADSDLDLMLLVDRPTTSKDPIDELYRGVAIEAGLRSVEDYATAEKILANPEIADHIAVGAILSDPTGLLASTQPLVERDFSAQRWVAARCDEEKQRFETSLALAEAAGSPLESIVQMMFVAVGLSGLLCVAQLVPPTHRKCLVLLREQLAALNRPQIYEQVLAGLGVADMARPQVQSLADSAATAFDRALEVKKTPPPLDFKLRPHLRAYLVDGTQTMIDRGNYREVVIWIAGGIAITTMCLLNDAPDEERPRYVALIEDLVTQTGYGPKRDERFRLTREAAASIFALADELVGR